MPDLQEQKPLLARRSPPLGGTVCVPGDKSISHRALILGALAVGETTILGLLEADDVLKTAGAMRALGAEVQRDSSGTWRVWGRGVGGLSEPEDVLDFGNSGTGSRLVMGAVATTPITCVFTGDASLRKRPMSRVLEPLTRFGARYESREGGLLPATLVGTGRPIAISHELAVASAQVKSALLLAALNAPGRTRLVQRTLTRDHTEKMLAGFGAQILVEHAPEGGEAISLLGDAELKSCAIEVPRDPSSAAFPMVAALIVPGSKLVIPSLLLNPRRTGLIETLLEMGARISVRDRRESGGEEIGDIAVEFSELNGVDVPPERAASMIDEYPVLAVAAAFAKGKSVMHGLEELALKESDRLTCTVKALSACGVRAEATENTMIVHGRGPGGVKGDARIATEMDHRIAMAFLTLGLASERAVSVDDASMIGTSFPGFERMVRDLGGLLAVPNR